MAFNNNKEDMLSAMYRNYFGKYIALNSARGFSISNCNFAGYLDALAGTHFKNEDVLFY